MHRLHWATGTLLQVHWVCGRSQCVDVPRPALTGFPRADSVWERMSSCCLDKRSVEGEHQALFWLFVSTTLSLCKDYRNRTRLQCLSIKKDMKQASLYCKRVPKQCVIKVFLLVQGLELVAKGPRVGFPKNRGGGGGGQACYPSSAGAIPYLGYWHQMPAILPDIS